MAAMIDVVFLLLIFFMTTSSFVLTERHLPSSIRVRSSSASADLQPAVVELVRGEQGYVYRVGQREIGSQQELTEVLRRFDSQAQGAFVRAADGAPFGMAAAAIQACKAAGFPTVSYIPLEPES